MVLLVPSLDRSYVVGLSLHIQFVYRLAIPDLSAFGSISCHEAAASLTLVIAT